MIKKSIILTFFIIPLFFSCYNKSQSINDAFKDYPHINIDEEYLSENIKYKPFIDYETGNINLLVENIGHKFFAITVKLDIISQNIDVIRDTQIALYLKNSHSNIFKLPFKNSDTPLIISFSEEYISKENKTLSTYQSIFTVGKKELDDKLKIEVIK